MTLVFIFIFIVFLCVFFYFELSKRDEDIEKLYDLYQELTSYSEILNNKENNTEDKKRKNKLVDL